MRTHNYFNQDFIKRYKPTIWMRLKLYFFGKKLCMVDLAHEDRETTVFATQYKGKIYIEKVQCSTKKN